MLKSYSYIESDQMDSGIIDVHVFAKERQIIADFTANNPTPMVLTSCVCCGENACVFVTVENVVYQRCDKCFSIFANVQSDTIDKYKSYEPLINFRNSEVYQHSATKHRHNIWNELLFWLEFRFARYIQKKAPLDIVHRGNRYLLLAEMLKAAPFCRNYNLTETADVFLFFDQFRSLVKPHEALSEIREALNESGLLVMNMTVGNGFDILTLRGRSDSFFPYEVTLLPSIKGVEHLLIKSGFDVLEISTPGTLDVEHVLRNKESLDENDLFIQYLINNADSSTHSVFQRFLQKSGMSSHARVIARKRNDFDDSN